MQQQPDVDSDPRHGTALLGVLLAVATSLVAAKLYYSVLMVEKQVSYNNPFATLGDSVLKGVLVLLLIAMLIASANLMTATPSRWRLVLGMWLPFFALSGVAMAVNLKFTREDEYYMRSHALIQERHVNLSGRKVWLAPSVDPEALAADPADIRWQVRTRTRKEHDDPMREYVMENLAPGLASVPVYLGPPARTPATAMPVRIGPALNAATQEKMKEHESTSDLVYMYYHYRDHIEIMPTVYFEDNRLPYDAVAQPPMLRLRIWNLRARPIIRLEVNGQTLHLKEAVRFQDANACFSHTHILAVASADQPLQVRWQEAQAMPVWNEARAEVAPMTPGVRPLEIDRNGKPENEVYLYFMADGSLLAHRTAQPSLEGKSSCVDMSSSSLIAPPDVSP